MQLYGCSIEMRITLLQVDSGPSKPEPWELSIDERVEIAHELKKEADDSFSRKKNYDKAADLYGKVIGYIQACLNQMVQSDFVRENRASVYTKDDLEGKIEVAKSNYCACKLYLGDYKEVIIQTSGILHRNGSHVKARWRRAKAYLALNEFDKAKVDLEYLKDNSENDESLLKMVDEEMKQIQVRLKEWEKKEAGMFKNIFSLKQREQ